MLYVVAPQAGLRLEEYAVERRMVALGIRLLAVNVSRQPGPRLDICPPAIKVQVRIVVRAVGIGAIEPNDVKVPIFHPNPYGEKTLGRFLAGLDIDHDAAYFPEEFLPHEIEVVVALLEVAVEDHHLREALRHKAAGEDVEPAKHALAKAGLLLLEQHIFRAFAHVEPTEKILIARRRDVVLFIFA